MNPSSREEDKAKAILYLQYDAQRRAEDRKKREEDKRNRVEHKPPEIDESYISAGTTEVERKLGEIRKFGTISSFLKSEERKKNKVFEILEKKYDRKHRKEFKGREEDYHSERERTAEDKIYQIQEHEGIDAFLGLGYSK